MQLTDGATEKADSRGRKTRLFPLLVGVAVVIVAWFGPSQKPDAVFGRLNYLQFSVAILLTAITMSVAMVMFTPQFRRRVTGFKVCAVWLGLILIVTVTEAIAWLLPPRHQMDNPFYFQAGGGTTRADALPFGRPAHLKWSGKSRGDMALLNDDEDPYAESVTFETDADGFRNSSEITQADIIAIGDSFTEAGYLSEEKTFCRLVGQRLSTSIKNLGRAGYTTPTELIVLKKYGLKCRPRFVIWQIAESNDLAEMLQYRDWAASGKDYFDVESKGMQTRYQAWQQRSPSFKLFSVFRVSTPRPWLLSGIFKDKESNEHPIRFYPSAGMLEPALHHPGWEGFTNALGQGVEICRSNNINVIVVLVPDKLRVFREFTLFEQKLAVWMAQRPGLAEPSLGTLLASFCASNQIPFLDTTKRLKNKAQSGELVYLPFDTHLSALGHQVVAEGIIEMMWTVQQNGPASTHVK